MVFEWDPMKNWTNIQKHGIDFRDAIHVFNDANYIEYYDYEHSNFEDRYIVLGKVLDIIVVVYTIRNDSARIISARKATEKERRIYYGRSL